MSRRRCPDIWKIVAIFLLLLVWVIPAHAAAKPNVIGIVGDDVGYGHMSTYGGPIATPNLDALAQAGVRFTNFHASPMCTPTRAELLSTVYAWRVNLPWALGAGTQNGLPPAVVTLAEAFKRAGYRTAMFGKWHLGELAKFSPVYQGFDQVIGLRGGEADYFSRINGKSGKRDWWNGLTPLAPTGYSTTEITNRAVSYIKSSSATQPFFLYLPYQAAHTPIEGPNDSAGHPVPSHFPDVVKALDNGLGAVVAALKAKGIYNNTIIVWFSDNGAGTLGYGGNGGLRGAKEALYEGGIRTPAVVAGPGIPTGVVRGGLVSVMDWYPTLLAAAQIPVTAPYRTDGVNILPYLRGTGAIPTRPLGDTLNWRTNSGSQTATLRADGWKLIIQPGKPDELYYLPADWSERHNVAAAHTDIVATLRANNAAWWSYVNNNKIK